MSGDARARGSEHLALAVDIGGTKVEAALVTGDGRVVGSSLARRATGMAIRGATLADAIAEVASIAARAVPDGSTITAAGIGSAGPVDLVNSTIAPLNLPAAAGLEVRRVVEATIPGIPVALALDGTCIALAEHAVGAARGYDNVLVMVISTGIGGGFILGGSPITGSSGNAGHIGQLPVRTRDPHDPAASTVEALASGPRSVAWARKRGWRGASGQDLADSYAQRDPIAQAAVRRSAGVVGEAVAAASTLLDLDVTVLAGGFMQVAEDYPQLVESAAHEAAMLSYARRVRVVSTGLDGEGPLIGAGLLALRGVPEIERAPFADSDRTHPTSHPAEPLSA